MKRKTTYRTNHRTGTEVRTRITRDGSSTRIQRDVKLPDGLFGTRFLGTRKDLTDKTIRRG